MRQTVYADMLFCVNFIIDYIMLISVKHIMSLRAGRMKMLFAAALGGMFSMILLIPPISFVLSALMSIAEAVIMSAAAFMPVRMKTVLKASGLLFCISFCFCGAMTAVCALFSPDNTLIRNGAVYIGISPTVLIDAVTTISLTIAPTVLGFTLAGYALMMGMSGSKVMQPIMDGEEKPTLFQKLNSTFAIVLGASFITTLVCVFIKIGISFVGHLSVLNYNLKICIKAFTLLTLVFLLIYTIFSIKDITINIFNFGQFAQTYHDSHADDERAAGDIIVIKESVLMRFLDCFRKKSK